MSTSDTATADAGTVQEPAEPATGSASVSAPEAASGLLARLRSVPWWAQVLVVYGLTRVWGAFLIILASRGQGPNPWSGANPGYFGMGVFWDGTWYRGIAANGYPGFLPATPTGAVVQNPWAFYPAYPELVRGVMKVTGLGFPVAGALTSLVLGALAMLVIYQLFVRFVSHRAALVGMLIVAVFPASPVLQISYTESAALLLLALAMLLLLRRQYVYAAGVVVVLSLTRPVVLPFAAIVLAHLIVRWRQRATDPLPRQDAGRIVVLGLISFASAWLWPLMAWESTGVRSAYTQTMGTWRSQGRVIYFEPWWFIAKYLTHGNEVEAAASLVALAAVVLLAVLGPWARTLGPELRTWVLAYSFYLAAVLEPWTSIYRYMIMLFPLALIATGPTKRPKLRAVIVGVLIVAFLIGQAWWVLSLLKFTPPSDYPP
jgi:hypothetical protein